MPPNVKETAAIIDSLATLDVNDLVHSKFLPLTQEEVSVSNDTNQKDTQDLRTNHKKDVIIDNILQEEENNKLFTVNHVESNLIRDAQQKESAVSDSTLSNDSYWFMPAPTEKEIAAAQEEQNNTKSVNGNTTKTNGDLYCLWHVQHEKQKRQELIASIIEEEKLRHFFSVTSIEASLITDAKRRGEHVSSVNAENDNYWMWEMQA